MDNFHNSFFNLLNNVSSPPNTSPITISDDSPTPIAPSSRNAPNPNYPSPQNFQGYPPYYPPQNPNFPPQNPNYPPLNPNYPSQNPNFPAQNPNFAPFANFPPHTNFPGYAQYPYPPVPIRPARLAKVEPQPDSRGRKFWTQDEDKVLVGAFSTISSDSVVGNNQTGRDFWKRVTKYYNDHVSGEHTRTQKQIKTHHHSMMKEVAEFIGAFNQAASRWPSGASDEHIMAEARETFMSKHEGKPFRFEHIFPLVREEAKWKTPSGFSTSYQSTKKTRINEAGEYTSSGPPETPASHAESTYDYPDSEPTPTEATPTEEPRSVERRPMGQKAAKRKGKAKAGEPSRDVDEAEDPAVDVSVKYLGQKYEVLAEAVVDYNQIARERLKFEEAQTKIAEERLRFEEEQKLFELEDKDTSNMTEQALAKHLARIDRYRRRLGYE